MQTTLLIASVALLSASSTFAYPSIPLAIYPAPIAPVVKSQYHAQDELGQYTYGYTDGLSAKAETKTFDGVTRGGYSYLDSNGVVQNVNYVSDPANGFRVAATNLPLAPVPPPAVLPVGPEPVQDTPEVAAAKAEFLAKAAVAAAEAEAAPSTDEPAPAEEPATAAPAEPAPAPAEPVPEVKVEAPVPVVPAPAPVIPVPAAAPIVPAPLINVLPPPAFVPAPLPAPVVYAAPAPYIAGPISSQYHSQDELGQYSYGYAGGPSAKSEIKTFDGITRGGYSYLDANGVVQSASYVSDPVNGFRVAATNIPVPAVPVAIPDSPEVAEAKAKHFALSAEAAAAAAASPATE